MVEARRLISILLDENIDINVRHLFPGFDVRTVDFMKWKGITNGQLLALAEDAFDILLTADKSIPYQQSLGSVQIAVIVVPSSLRQTIETLKPDILKAIKAAMPGQYYVIQPS
jgi:hypothetical protein